MFTILVGTIDMVTCILVFNIKYQSAKNIAYIILIKRHTYFEWRVSIKTAIPSISVVLIVVHGTLKPKKGNKFL